MDDCSYPSALRQKECNSTFFEKKKVYFEVGGELYVEGRERDGEINYFYRIFMKFRRKDKLGVLIDTWSTFLLSNKILDAAVHGRLICCECAHQCQKPERVTPCHALVLMEW